MPFNGIMMGGIAGGMSQLAQQLAEQKMRKQQMGQQSFEAQQRAAGEQAIANREQSTRDWNAGAMQREIQGKLDIGSAIAQLRKNQPGGPTAFSDTDLTTGKTIAPEGYLENQNNIASLQHLQDPLGAEMEMSRYKQSMHETPEQKLANQEALTKFKYDKLPPRPKPGGPGRGGPKNPYANMNEFIKIQNQIFKESLNEYKVVDPKLKAAAEAKYAPALQQLQSGSQPANLSPVPQPQASANADDVKVQQMIKSGKANTIRQSDTYKANPTYWEGLIKKNGG